MAPKEETVNAECPLDQNGNIIDGRLILKVRNRLKDLDCRLTNAEISRFLRGRDYNLEAAEEMLRKSIEWKKSVKFESAINWKMPQRISDHFGYYFDGCDVEGRSVLYLPVGRWEVRKMLNEGLKEDMERYAIKVMSQWMKLFDEAFKGEAVVIVDLAELTYWKVAHYETVQITLKMIRYFEANFPERLKKGFVINAPWAFYCIYPMVKPLLSGKTLQKVQIFDSNISNYLQAITACIHQKDLPAKFREYHSMDVEVDDK